MSSQAEALLPRAEPERSVKDRGAPLHGEAAFAWRMWVTAICLFLAAFAAHDAFMVRLGDSWHFTYAPDQTYSLSNRLEVVVRFFTLAFALLVAWRSRLNLNARLLAWGLVGASCDIYWEWYGTDTQPFWVYFPMLLKYAGLSYGSMQLLRFAASFGVGDYRNIRATLYKYAWLAFVVPFAFGVLSQVLGFGGKLQYIPGYDSSDISGSDLHIVHAFYLLSDALAKVAMIAAAYIGYRSSTDEERPKMALIVGSLTIFAAGTAFHFILYNIHGDLPWLRAIDTLCTLVLPVGLVSAAQKALFLDVELFIDPAVGFGILFVLIALGIYLAEEGGQGIIKWLTDSATQATHNVFPAGFIFWYITLTMGALLIAVANHFHDEIVSRTRNLVFPGRADRLKELEEDMAKIVMSPDPASFKDQLAKSLSQHAKARFVHAYALSDGRFRPILAFPQRDLPELEGHEQEIQRMREQKSSIQLDDNPSIIPGVRAFPMFLSGKLTGFVVCGPSTVQARYGDDEIELIEALARVAGATYRVLLGYGDAELTGV